MKNPINKARCALHRFSVSTGGVGLQGRTPIDAGVFGNRLTLTERYPCIHLIRLDRFISLMGVVPILLASHLVQADQPGLNPPRVIEVFTATDRPVSPSSIDRLRGQAVNIELQVYRIDGIQQVEGALSRHLPRDPAVAKRVALNRIQQLDDLETARLHQAAIGLTKALQYGIDRFPAMVFDGQCVVYGVTELGQALRQYHLWKSGT